MSLPRLDNSTRIADRLNELAAIVKTRSLTSLTDANHILETITKRFFNALHGWDLVNLNVLQANYPAADLGDPGRRIAIQVTNEDGSGKITHTATKAAEHKLGDAFDQLFIFFLLPKKPRFPKKFIQPPNGPEIETWDIADLLKKMQEMDDLEPLTCAARVLDEEMGKIRVPDLTLKFDISRILKYAPAELIGREAEIKSLTTAWAKVRKGTKKRPHVLSFVALGGEGKTSLVAKWAVDEMLAKGWPECDAAFAWSFYSQGTREQLAASSDLFLKEALTFFGDDADKEFAESPAGAFEKGQRLARLVAQRRSLLILDGLEPLQYAPSSPMPGGLKDQGIAALLKCLAATSHGLCVVTTRYSIPDMKAFWQTTAPEKPLLRLSKEAGVHLLQQLGVRKESGSKAEFEKLVEDVKGHALTLTLLGGYLKRAFHGDIRQRDHVKFEKADEKKDGGHAFRTMAAYERWLLCDGGDEGRCQAAVLRLMGLFDRPADAGCIDALLQPPAIKNLTEPVVNLADDDWGFCLDGLESAKLLTVNSVPSGELVSLDAHPLIREYFARQLRTQQPDTWRAAHRRLYKHLCANTKEGDQPTLENLQPLYQAVAHGCSSGLGLEAYRDVFVKRILRDEKFYSVMSLGAVQSDLGAMRAYFTQPYNPQSIGQLQNEDKALLLKHIGYCLRATTKLRDAKTILRAAANEYKKNGNVPEATSALGLLSSTLIFLGDLQSALDSAKEAADLIDESCPDWIRVSAFSRIAEVLQYMKKFPEGDGWFKTTFDVMGGVNDAKHWIHTFLSGKENVGGRTAMFGVLFRYCDYLIAREDFGETLCWVKFAGRQLYQDSMNHERSVHAGFVELFYGQISIDSTRRANMKEEIGEILVAGTHLKRSLELFRNSEREHEVPRSLISLAILDGLGGNVGSETQGYLDEAWEIAVRGPMKLHMADIHLYRARIFFRENDYPWNKNPDGSPRGPWDDLDAAGKLIKECGYHRRDQELADAKKAILGE